MRVSKVISVLRRRDEWLAEKLLQIADSNPKAASWLEEEKRAIEVAIEICGKELARRHIELMEQRLSDEEAARLQA
jgi:hypothetical protein